MVLGFLSPSLGNAQMRLWVFSSRGNGDLVYEGVDETRAAGFLFDNYCMSVKLLAACFSSW